MAALQKFAAASMNPGSSTGQSKTDEDLPNQFPAGLRVLVVDDDMTCLTILERMLRKCDYIVTICTRATSALSILRDNKNNYDLVLSDVHMPDMDGFKLLELIGLEMDLPVIMMSADRRTEMVMKGVKHGACDYLIKPVRFEELKNIWQHVVRKKWSENREHEQSGSVDDSDKHRRVADDAEYTSSANDGNDCSWKSQKKKRDPKEEDDEGELESDDPSTSKKPRVVWSVELHQQFVNAVNQLGIDKAVPKRILELMNVPGLTRENVASHLQKFRLYLKRLSGVAQHQGVGLQNPMCGPVDPASKVGPLSRLDIQSLAASGQIPPQTLAALHAELLGRPGGTGVGLPPLDQPPPVILQPSLQAQPPKCVPVDRDAVMGKPLMKCPPGVVTHFQPAVDDLGAGFSSWLSGGHHTLPQMGSNPMINGVPGPSILHQQPQQLTLPEPGGGHRLAVNTLPSSCLVSQSPQAVYQMGNGSHSGTNPFATGQNASAEMMLRFQLSKALQAGGGAPAFINHSQNMLFAPPDSMPVGVGHVVHGGGGGYFDHGGPAAPAVSAPGFEPHGRNLGFVGKDHCIPSRFAVDDVEPPAYTQNNVGGADQAGGAPPDNNTLFGYGDGGVKVAAHFPPGDVMSVLSK